MSENQLTPEQKQQQYELSIKALKENILNELHQKYRVLLDSINRLPFPKENLTQALLYLDSGMLWIKEIVTYSPIIVPVPPIMQPQVPQQESKDNMPSI